MANDRLFLFDPATNRAVLLAKTWGVGWIYYGRDADIEAFMDDLREKGGADSELELKRESDFECFPRGLILYMNGPKQWNPESGEFVEEPCD